MDTNVVLESLYYISKKLSKSIDKLSAIKLLFFADKYHLRKYGRLITDDTYYALPHGPVPSNSLNIINQVLSKEDTGSKIEYLKIVDNQLSANEENLELDNLSDTDKEALDFVIDKFGHMESWDLRNLTHDYPEWKRFKETLESQSTKRELIVMEDFFADSNLQNDPFLEIPKRAVELSKAFYLGNF